MWHPMENVNKMEFNNNQVEIHVWNVANEEEENIYKNKKLVHHKCIYVTIAILTNMEHHVHGFQHTHKFLLYEMTVN